MQVREQMFAATDFHARAANIAGPLRICVKCARCLVVTVLKTQGSAQRRTNPDKIVRAFLIDAALCLLGNFACHFATEQAHAAGDFSEQLADPSVRAKNTEDAMAAAQKEAHDKIVARKEQARCGDDGGRKGESEIKSAGNSPPGTGIP